MEEDEHDRRADPLQSLGGEGAKQTRGGKYCMWPQSKARDDLLFFWDETIGVLIHNTKGQTGALGEPAGSMAMLWRIPSLELRCKFARLACWSLAF